MPTHDSACLLSPLSQQVQPCRTLFGAFLKSYWNGALLDSVSTALNFTRTVTWNQQHPVVKLVHTIYHKGVRLTAKAMAFLEQHFERLPGLEKYFLLIRPQPQTLSG